MKHIFQLSFCLFLATCPFSLVLPKATHVDILIIGGGTSGIAAGIQSSRMGVSTLIIEETTWLGGMLTSAGVSAIDGNQHLPAGIWGEFKEKLSDFYGGTDSLRTGWVSNVLFEPSIGNRIFHEMAGKEDKLQIWKQSHLTGIKRSGDKWIAKVQKKKETFRTIYAKIIIDATELGDVAKMCGVKYDIGMESREVTHEDIAPAMSNHIIQDLTYVAILKDYGKDVTIPKPQGYDPNLFSCACINDKCIVPKEPNRMWSKDKMITYGKLPNQKYMINWPIEGNDYYINLIEMSPKERQNALKYAKRHTMYFIYFIQHELGYNTLGLADDEYPTEDKLPFIPYHRESRRIHGLVRFTLNHIIHPYKQKEKLYRTCIAVGDYPVDHHHTSYHGYEELPNLYFRPIPSFGLPLGTLIPQQVDGLIVAEKSISVSNITNGTTRLQPVVLQIGQAAGILGALAIKNNMKIADVPVREVQNNILSVNGYLLPFLDVPVNDPKFVPYQHIGATGILQGTGKNAGWSNQTWLRADTTLLVSELDGLIDIYPYVKEELNNLKKETISIYESLQLIHKIAETEGIAISAARNIKEIWHQYALCELTPDRKITRGEFAILVDQILDPFYNKQVTIAGEIIHSIPQPHSIKQEQ